MKIIIGSDSSWLLQLCYKTEIDQLSNTANIKSNQQKKKAVKTPVSTLVPSYAEYQYTII